MSISLSIQKQLFRNDPLLQRDEFLELLLEKMPISKSQRTIQGNFSFYLWWFLLNQVLALSTEQITTNDPITIFDFRNRSIDFHLFSTYCLGSFI